MLEGMKMYLASNNRHKRVEMARLFPGFDIRLPAEEGIGFDFEETGDSFLENALGKARALYDRVRRPVLADDSGLCVAALGGEPGLHSARYGAEEVGVEPSDGGRVRYLLEKMEGAENRSCFFVCCLVLVLEEQRFFVAQETAAGVLARQPAGAGGFGYDPVFILPGTGRTMAELSDAEKDRVSHRGRAARRLLGLLATED